MYIMNKGGSLDLLRSVLRIGKYQLADEQLVLDRKKEERHRRQELGGSRKQQHDEKHRKSSILFLTRAKKPSRVFQFGRF
jgi:hypothetical protein